MEPFENTAHVYRQISEGLRQEIRAGRMRDKIPGVWDLAKRYRVNVKTVSKAVSLLLQEGLLYRVQGKGTYVGDPETLSQKHPLVAGLVIPTLINPYYAKFAEALQSEAEKKSIGVFVNTLSSRKNWFRNLVSEYRKRGVKAVIINDLVLIRDPGVNTELKRSSLAAVEFGVKTDHSFRDAICNDIKEGAWQAASHLVQTYGAPIAHVSGCTGRLQEDGRFTGYRKALQDLGLKFDGRYVKKVPNNYRGAYEAVQELLRLKARPKAIFMYNDFMAASAENAIQETGLRIPRDIGIMGFDDSIEPDEMLVPTSSVLYSYEGSARCLLDLLVRRVLDPFAKPKIVRIEPRLILRESTRLNPRFVKNLQQTKKEAVHVPY